MTVVDSLTEYMLESEKNLRLAEATYVRYEAARQQIMVGFFKRLTARLTQVLPGWEFHYDAQFFTDKYGAYSACNPAWRKQYFLQLEAFEHGDRIIYGIWRDEDKLRNRRRSAPILAAVQKVHPSAKSRIYYEAEITLRSPAPDWRPPAILWRIHKDPNFLEDVALQLLEVVELTDKQVKALVKT